MNGCGLGTGRQNDPGLLAAVTLGGSRRALAQGWNGIPLRFRWVYQDVRKFVNSLGATLLPDFSSSEFGVPSSEARAPALAAFCRNLRHRR